MGFDMYGKTAGIIETDKIGILTGGILNGLGMRALAYDPYPDPQAAKEYGFEYTDLKTLCRKSQIIYLHCPLAKETE
ncbi:MAG: D-isomer specific 2-hydroxyacid dehydrogenase [Marinimicrobia bacterium 46_43]|nr:MAG: D-isomer specific 2-hydroxyacid dehydrogenase [Marinimicrobia bacterium 46_43]